MVVLPARLKYKGTSAKESNSVFGITTSHKFIDVGVTLRYTEYSQMGKLNWSCTSCGMSSGRKFSVQRHINNQNIHNGSGQVVPYVQYSIGIKEGNYIPQNAGQFAQSRAPYLNKIEAEVENLVIREIARRIYNNLVKNEAVLDNIQAVATANIVSKNLKDILR